MNINRINQVYQVYKNSGAKKVDKASGVSAGKDVVNISNEAKDFQTALQSAMKAEDVREDLVNDIKQKMDAGEYEVNTDDLVDKIMNKHTK